jgi:enoyl-CoA hydratase/carnithine racemase
MNYEIGSVMTHEVFNYSQNGHIAVLTINRPEARNALNPEVLVKLATLSFAEPARPSVPAWTWAE